MPTFFLKEIYIRHEPVEAYCIRVVYPSHDQLLRNMAIWNESTEYQYIEVPESCLKHIFTPKEVRYLIDGSRISWPKHKLHLGEAK